MDESLAANNDLAPKIIAIVASATRRDPIAICADVSFEQQGIDSLDKINIFFELESAFDINIPDDEARDIHTVNQIVERMRLHFRRQKGSGA